MEGEERGVSINLEAEFPVKRWERGLRRQLVELLTWVEMLLLKQGFREKGRTGMFRDAFCDLSRQ